MLRNISKFAALTKQEKRLFLEAYLLLGAMRIALLTISFKRLTHSLEHAQDRIDVGHLNEEQRQSAVMIGEAIERAAAHTPWESACLAQALTAQRMLSKRDIPGMFYLGAAKNDSQKVKAHAWTQCEDVIITGAKGHEAFTVLSVFGWRIR